MTYSKRLAVLVAERNGEWADWLTSLRDHAIDEVDEVTVILQRGGESASDLAARVREQVRDIDDDVELVAAAVVGGGRFSPELIPARSTMIRALVSRMVAKGSGQLFLSPGSTTGPGRHAMTALAAVVEEQIVSTGVRVHTRTDAPPPPVIFPEAASADNDTLDASVAA